MGPKQACNKHVKLSIITNAAQLAQATNNVLRRTQVKTIALEYSSSPRQSTFFFRYLSSSFKNIRPFPRTRAVVACVADETKPRYSPSAK